jgi:hypothetical protein
VGRLATPNEEPPNASAPAYNPAEFYSTTNESGYATESGSTRVWVHARISGTALGLCSKCYWLVGFGRAIGAVPRGQCRPTAWARRPPQFARGCLLRFPTTRCHGTTRLPSCLGSVAASSRRQGYVQDLICLPGQHDGSRSRLHHPEGARVRPRSAGTPLRFDSEEQSTRAARVISSPCSYRRKPIQSGEWFLLLTEIFDVSDSLLVGASLVHELQYSMTSFARVLRPVTAVWAAIGARAELGRVCASRFDKLWVRRDHVVDVLAGFRSGLGGRAVCRSLCSSVALVR